MLISLYLHAEKNASLDNIAVNTAGDVLIDVEEDTMEIFLTGSVLLSSGPKNPYFLNPKSLKILTLLSKFM